MTYVNSCNLKFNLHISESSDCAYMTRETLIACASQLQLDICVLEDFNSILLVFKVDRHSRGFDPEARLVSDTIAVSRNTNGRRVKRLGIDSLTSKVMPGIVMDGTMPTFYKIPVTPELVRAVESGEHPEEETVVYAYRPEVPIPEEGMRSLDNRYIILFCFEAFRKFM